MSKSTCFIFHKWGKWSVVFEGFNGNSHQYRKCKQCGTVKGRKAPFQTGGILGEGAVNKALEEKLDNE